MRFWEAWSNHALETAHIVSVLAGGVWPSCEPTSRPSLRLPVCERGLAAGTASSETQVACRKSAVAAPSPLMGPARRRSRLLCTGVLLHMQRGKKPLAVPHPPPRRGGPPVRCTTHAEGLLSEPQGPWLSPLGTSRPSAPRAPSSDGIASFFFSPFFFFLM